MLTPPGRRRCAIVALAIWTQACTAYRPAPPNARLAEWRRVRVTAAEPFAVKVPTSASTLVTACRATDVEGQVRRVAGDTLVLTTSGDGAMAPEQDGRPRLCPQSGEVTIVLTPAMNLEAKETDTDRSIALVIGLSFAAFAGVMYHIAHTPGPPITFR